MNPDYANGLITQLLGVFQLIQQEGVEVGAETSILSCLGVLLTLSRALPYSASSTQGGTDTPNNFWAAVAAALKPVILRWKECKWGVELQSDLWLTHLWLTHLNSPAMAPRKRAEAQNEARSTT